MATEYSFDIVSKIDLQEVDNAVNQAKKMILTRYDLKGTKCRIDFDRKESQIKLVADDKMKYEAVLDMLRERLASRSVSMKALKLDPEEQALDGTITQILHVQSGISSEHAKDIAKMIRDLGLKVQPQIQADQLRVTGRNKDDLQQVMTFLKQKELPIPIQFANYR